MEPTATAAQQNAVASVRARYEQGEISYETLRSAIDAIVAARSAAECDAILRELPASPLSALAALEPPAEPPAPIRGRPAQSIVAVMAQTKKLRRPWELQSTARVTAVMGEVKLDLGRATLPPRARIRVRMVMGDVTLYVPSSVHVTVRSRVYLGDTTLLGEGTGGIVAASHEEHVPDEPASAELEIDALTIMGNLKVVLTDGSPTVSIGELVRDTLAMVTEGLRRGLQPGIHLPADRAGVEHSDRTGE